MNDDEEQLVTQSREGDRDAYGELIRRYQQHVRTFIKIRILDESAADDLAQEVFVAGFKSFAKFRGQGSLKSWLCGIAKYKIIDFLRAEGRKKQVQSELQMLLQNPERRCLADQAEQELDEAVVALRKCLELLKPNARKIVNKYYFENQSAVQIGSESDQKPGAIRMSLMRIRNALAKCMRKSLNTGLGK